MRALLFVLLISGCGSIDELNSAAGAQTQKVVGFSCSIKVKDYTPPPPTATGQPAT